MGAVSPTFLFDIESRMRVITETEYNRLTANLCWQRFARMRPSSGKKEIINWLLSTAYIEDQGSGGSIAYDDLCVLDTTITNSDAGKGLRLRKQLLEDMYNGQPGGEGIDLASQWAAQIGAQMAYWPQKQIFALLKLGESSTYALGYDSLAYFSAVHPLNPYNTGLGTYANLFTSTSSGTYPGACPIDDTVSVDVAFKNLAKVLGYIAQIKMPNGTDPRFLKPLFLMGAPRLGPRLQQLTNAKFIGQAAGSSGASGGSGDISAVISNWNLGPPIEAPELAYDSVYTDGDTSWYVVTEQVASTQLGGIIYQEREPFKISYYSGESGGENANVMLGRSREVEWQVHGRNAVAPGHPYLIHKVKAT